MKILRGRVVQVIESYDMRTCFLESFIVNYLKNHPSCRVVILENITHPKNPIMRFIHWLMDGCKCTYQKRIITDRFVKIGDLTEFTSIQLKVPTNYYVTFEEGLLEF